MMVRLALLGLLWLLAACSPEGGRSAGLSGAEDCQQGARRAVNVASATQLQAALANAEAGDAILLEDGEYLGPFVAERDGTPQAPIRLCGSPKARLLGRGVVSGVVLRLSAKYWILAGFSLSQANKGLLLDGANHNQTLGLHVHGVGQEAIRLRNFSSDNRIQSCRIWDTGLVDAGTGEGIYIGTTVSQWAEVTGDANTPDRSDRNVVEGCQIGPDVRA